jgi:hypothetical protein
LSNLNHAAGVLISKAALLIVKGPNAGNPLDFGAAAGTS